MMHNYNYHGVELEVSFSDYYGRIEDFELLAVTSIYDIIEICKYEMIDDTDGNYLIDTYKNYTEEQQKEIILDNIIEDRLINEIDKELDWAVLSGD